MKPKISDLAHGKWRGILMALGVESGYLTGKHGPCPACRDGKDRYRFDDKFGKGNWICSACAPQGADGFEFLKRVKGLDFKEAAKAVESVIGEVKALPVRRPPDEKALRASLNDLWRKAKPIATDDPVDKYLRRRRLPLPDQRYIRTIEDLKYHDEPPSWHWGMLAMVVGPDGKPSTLHRTYLTNDGRKAPVEAVRRLHAGRVAKGGAVRCIPMKADTDVLGIAEGIETALAAFKVFGVPCWAAVSAQMLEAWTPPPEAKRIVIFGDSDKSFTGQASAYVLAKRLTLVDKLSVEVELPSWGKPLDVDWNDILMEGRDGLHKRGKAGSSPAGTQVPEAGVRSADRGGHNDARLRQGAD